MVAIIFVASVFMLAARPLLPANVLGHPLAQQDIPMQPPQATPSLQAAPSAGPVIVLDPGHGGTDTGARGESGAVEKDVVLEFARSVRGELERQGFHVVMTRNDDSNPSYDDRAAIANANRDALFITFHISSTGSVGTARSYFYQFWTPIPAVVAATTGAQPSTPAAPGLTVWEEAQRPHVDASHRFADALQAEISQRFPNSPSRSIGVAIRGLRSIDSPAVAIEISSVSVSDPNSLTALAAPLATSIAQGVTAFHSASLTGSK